MKPRLFLSLLFIAVSLVFTVMLGTSAFVQNQTDTDGKTIEQATITTNAHLSNNPKCDTLEKYDVVMSPKCDSASNYEVVVITFPPKFFYHIFHKDTGIIPGGGSYSQKMDYQLWAKYAGYLAQQNKLAQRGETDFSSIKDEPVKVTVYLNENECKFVDGLGIKESDFSCKNEMPLDVPPSNLEKLADLDFVTTVGMYLEPNWNVLEDTEPSISERNPIEPTTIESVTNDIEQATITMNAHLSNNPKCDTLEKYGAIMSPKCDSDKKDLQFIIITFPPEFFYHIYNSDNGIGAAGGSHTYKMDYQLWAKYAGYLAQQNKLAQRGETDFSSIKDEPVKVKLYLNENECKFVDGLGIKESDFSCKNEMPLDVPPSKLEKLADLDFVESIKLPSADEIVEVEGITFPDNGEPSISERNPIEPTTIESVTNDIEQATITMNAKLYETWA